MTPNDEFELDADELTPAEATPPQPPAPQPIVVVQYRNRGIPLGLLPPVLILLLALAITSYRRQTPVRPTVAAGASKSVDRPAPVGPGRIIMVESPSEGVSYERIVVRDTTVPSPESATEPAPAPSASPSEPADVTPVPPPVRPPGKEKAVAIALPAPEPAPAQPTPNPGPPAPPAREKVAAAAAPAPKVDPPSPFDLVDTGAVPGVEAAPAGKPGDLRAPEAPPPRADRESGPRPAIGFVPPEPDGPAGLEPPAQPKLTKEDVEEQIRREAELKKAEQEDLAQLKPRLRVSELVEAIRKAQADRPAFHDELRQVIRSHPNDAGDRIDDLCEVYGRSTLPEIRAFVLLALKKPPPRWSSQDKVEMMRSSGLPEPMILDNLARHVHNYSLNARNGPRNEDEVRVEAARQLLAMPPRKAASSQAERSAQMIIRALSSVNPASSASPARRP
jgi:hypothetical protein